MPKAPAKLLNYELSNAITDHPLIWTNADHSFEKSSMQIVQRLKGYLGTISAIVEISWRIEKGLTYLPTEDFHHWSANKKANSLTICRDTTEKLGDFHARHTPFL